MLGKAFFFLVTPPIPSFAVTFEYYPSLWPKRGTPEFSYPNFDLTSIIVRRWDVIYYLRTLALFRLPCGNLVPEPCAHTDENTKSSVLALPSYCLSLCRNSYLNSRDLLCEVDIVAVPTYPTAPIKTTRQPLASLGKVRRKSSHQVSTPREKSEAPTPCAEYHIFTPH